MSQLAIFEFDCNNANILEKQPYYEQFIRLISS